LAERVIATEQGVRLAADRAAEVLELEPVRVLGLYGDSLDLVAALIVSSLLRRHLSLRLWRAIHLLAYVSWPVALWHTLGTGTDASTAWLRLTSIACITVVVTALASRLLRRSDAAKHLARQVST